MHILAVLGIEVTACVTILDRMTRRPTARAARLHTGREAPKSSIKGNDSWATHTYGELTPMTGRAP